MINGAKTAQADYLLFQIQELGAEAEFVEGKWDGLLAGRIGAALNAEVPYYDYMEEHREAMGIFRNEK